MFREKMTNGNCLLKVHDAKLSPNISNIFSVNGGKYAIFILL